MHIMLATNIICCAWLSLAMSVQYVKPSLLLRAFSPLAATWKHQDVKIQVPYGEAQD